MYWSICVPSSCKVEEVRLVIENIFNMATKQQISVRLSEDKCHVNRTQPITAGEIVYGYVHVTSGKFLTYRIYFSCILGFFCVFILFATVYHYYSDTGGRCVIKEAILCFSVINTVGKFLTTRSSSLNLDCLSGIKFISMLFIIAGHTFLFVVAGPVQNTDFFSEVPTQLVQHFSN